MRFALLSLWLFALSSQPAVAGDDGAGPAWTTSFETIREAAAGVKTVSARFTQHKHLKILAKPLQSTGRFVFAAPDSIRWEYEAPLRSVLLMDKGKLARWAKRGEAWVPDAAARVETMRVVVAEIQGWLLGRFEQSKTFSAALEPGNPARVVLTPNDPAMADFIQRIVLTLAGRPGELASVEIVESASARTVLDFEDSQLNPALPPDAFEPPR